MMASQLLFATDSAAQVCRSEDYILGRPACLAGTGTDTGNGGNGGSIAGMTLTVPPLATPSIWCASLSGFLTNALSFARLLPTNLESRMNLVANAQALTAAYERGEFAIYPTTYTLLTRALAINNVIPTATQHHRCGFWPARRRGGLHVLASYL